MGTLNVKHLRRDALLLLDSAPIIYIFERHPTFGPRFRPVFEAHAEGVVRFAISPVTIAEVLTGPHKAGDEALGRRYRALFESCQIVPLDAAVAESAARLRAAHRLKLFDAVQAASALAINADALVTHDRDFARLKGLRIIA
jgi:predicted nucleic acid-binding protein